jgi:hypothetical protein
VSTTTALKTVLWRGVSRELSESRWEPGLPDHVSSKFWGAYRGGKPEPEHLWHHDHGELQVVKKSAKIPGHEEWLGNDYGCGDSFHGRVKGDVGVVNTVYPTDRQRLMAGRVKKDLERAFPHVKTWYVPDKELSVHFQESNMSEAKHLINELSEGHTNEDEYQRLARHAAENTHDWVKNLGNRSHGAGTGQDLKWEDRFGTNRVSTEHLAETEHGAYRVSPAGFGSWTLQYHPHGGSLITVKRLFSAEDAKRFAQSHHNTRYDAGGKLMREARERWDTDPDPTNEKKRFGATAMFRYVGPHGYSENLHVYQDESGNKQYVDASTGETFKDLGAAMESVKLSSRSNAYHKVQHRKVSEAREIVAELGESGFESSPFRSGTYQDTGTELVYNAGHGRYYYSKSTGRVSYHKAMTAPRSSKTTRGSGVELGMAKNQEHAMRMIRNHQVPIEQRRASGLPEGPGQPKPYQRRLTGLESRDQFLLDPDDWHDGAHQHPDEGPVTAKHRDGKYTIHASASGYHVRHEEADHGHSGVWGKFYHKPETVSQGHKTFEDAQDSARQHYLKNYAGHGGAYMAEAREVISELGLEESGEGFHVETYNGGRWNTRSWHATREEADAELRRVNKSIGGARRVRSDREVRAELGYAKWDEDTRRLRGGRQSSLPEGPGQPKPYQRRLTGLESRDQFLLDPDDWHDGAHQHPDEGPVTAKHRDGKYTIHASASGYHVRHEEADHGHSGVWGKFYHKPETVSQGHKTFEDAQDSARQHYLKNYAGHGGAYMAEARAVLAELGLLEGEERSFAGQGHDLKWETYGKAHKATAMHGQYQVSPDGYGTWALVYRPNEGEWKRVKSLFSAQSAKQWAQSHHNTQYGAVESLREGISYEAGHTTKPGTPDHLISIGQQMEKDGSPVFNKGASTAERMIAEHAAITGEHRSTIAAKAEQMWKRAKAERERGVKSTDGHGPGWNKGAGTYNGNWNKRGA